MVARFEGRNPRAENWLKKQSSDLITKVTEKTKDAVRSVLRDGMEAGRGPRGVALDIVGSFDRKEGRRVGGLIGLTERDKVYADRALEELTSGNRASLSNYLNRKARDRRFDPIVERAIRDGEPIDRAKALKMQQRYKDRLLFNRGETIARTELLQSLHQSQDEALQQMLDRGVLQPDQITRVWDAANDSDTRESHLAMDGQERRKGEPFTTGDGYLMMYPGDSSLGAPGGEIINCRCRIRPKIDVIKGLRR